MWLIYQIFSPHFPRFHIQTRNLKTTSHYNLDKLGLPMVMGCSNTVGGVGGAAGWGQYAALCTDSAARLCFAETVQKRF